MLAMEPPLTRLRGLTFKSVLTEEDILRMRSVVRNEFGKIQNILKQVSSSMLLVFRCPVKNFLRNLLFLFCLFRLMAERLFSISLQIGI
jgi:hypothetical protein